MTPYLKALIPPLFALSYNKIRGKGVQWSGNYSSWEQALKNCNGYEDAEIFQKVKKAAIAVKEGEAIYERDSVLFYQPAYSWELIANLLKMALEEDGELCVLDFGGAFGSTYFQNRSYLSGINNLTWCIVEQAHFVDFGKKHFENDTLRFYYSLDEVLVEHKPRVLLLLSVLQYLPNPWEWIQKFKESGIPDILIDRTAFIGGNSKDKLTIQKIPKNIYRASYPAWFFNEDKFVATFEPEFELVAANESNITKSIFLGAKEAYWKNFVFRKNNEST